MGFLVNGGGFLRHLAGADGSSAVGPIALSGKKEFIVPAWHADFNDPSW